MTVDQFTMASSTAMTVSAGITELTGLGATFRIGQGNVLVQTTDVVSVPRSQIYYWSPAWQENERIALAELANGQGREFDNASDAIHWLLSED